MRAIRTFLLISAVLWPMAPPVAGAEESGTPCAFEVDISLSPGLSREPSSGSFDSQGESGQLDCQGSVGGQPATGPGTFGAEGRYGIDGDGDDCRSKTGQGDGTAHFTVPVEGGTQHVDDPFTMTYRVEGRSVVGEIIGRRFSGTFDVTHAEGDCLWKPVTRIRIKGQGHLREAETAEAPLPS